MARLAAILVLTLPLALAGCAANSGAGRAPSPGAEASTPTVFDLQRQIDNLETQIELMREQIRELQTGQAGKTF
ncbi:MAG: hypothetical protein QNJ30_12330 [Kiloniellales bacterium]|nr:hypothetical protein [Kiloniellales bacterium]